MEKKEVEEILREKSDEIEETPDFNKIWEKIQPRIEKEKKRRFVWRRILLPVACCAVVLGITLPFVLPQLIHNEPTTPPPVLYLNDDLQNVIVEEAEFHQAIQNSDVQVVDLTRFKLDVCSVFKTETGVVKGGNADFMDSQESPTCVINLDFYGNDVQVSNTNQIVYDTFYTTQSGAVIEYKFDQELSQYHIKAEYNSVQYFMDYTGVNETVTQFFENFFI